MSNQRFKITAGGIWDNPSSSEFWSPCEDLDWRNWENFQDAISAECKVRVGLPCLLPLMDPQLQGCMLDKTWPILVAESKADKHVMKTGGLGKLMQDNKIEVWLCYRGMIHSLV